ncbi:MAG: DinB family protein [Chloroflexota bacterium]
MNRSDITTMVAYNFWANKRIISACEGLKGGEFTRAVIPDPGWGSLQGILVHMMDVEFGWRSNIMGLDASKIFQPVDYPDVAKLKAGWAVEEKAWLDFLAEQDDESINRVFREENSSRIIVWQTIMHVMMHSMQHRSEAAYILTGYGQSPGELDFGIYLSKFRAE